MNIWALIPVKTLLDSKRRLSRLLPAQQRAILIHCLLQQELMVLNEVAAISNVLVISSDPAVWQLARQFNAQVAKEGQPQGLNSAVSRGMAVAAAEGADAAFMLPADLPFINASDVEILINAGLGQWQEMGTAPAAPSSKVNGTYGQNLEHHIMAICSDEEGKGTNALLLNPIVDFDFQFGPVSYRLHTQEAQKRGITVRKVSTPGLQFDLDNEKDWFAYRKLVSLPEN